MMTTPLSMTDPRMRGCYEAPVSGEQRERVRGAV